MVECPPAKKRRISNDLPPDDPVKFTSPATNETLDWDYEKTFYINLGESFSSAELPQICKVIMDNPIFCRLRYIRQTGVCHYVFPDTTHSRFTHSVGTAVIAFRLVKKLQTQKLNGKLPMTGSEMLAVVIAALCHDLGHGPFSHLCEELFIQDDGTHFTHEEMGVILFDKMLIDYPEIKHQLQKHFTEYHFKLIKDLINPPPFPESPATWTLLASPEKAFLYAIVNNPITGLDVDKLQYLFHDSKRSGVIQLTAELIDRFIQKVRICQNPDHKFHWLAFAESEVSNIRSIFNARKDLHTKVYGHKNVLVINEMFVHAFKLASPHISFKYKSERVTLKQCFSKNYLDLYIRLVDDYLKTKIQFSTSDHPDMIEARKIINDVESRKFSKLILSFDGLAQYYPCLESGAIKLALKKCKQLSFEIEDLVIIRRDFHGGKGLTINPMEKVLFYGRSDTESSFFIRHESKHASFGESTVYIFAPNSCKESDVVEITKILTEYSTENDATLIPRRKFRNNENAMPYF